MKYAHLGLVLGMIILAGGCGTAPRIGSPEGPPVHAPEDLSPGGPAEERPPGAEGFEVEGSVLVRYEGTEEDLNIPSALGIREIGNGAFRGAKIRRIHLPDTLRVIGEGAFRDCSLLEAIEIPPGVRVIRDYTFFHCVNLAAVSLPEGITEIGQNAFTGCSRLRDLEIPATVTRLSDYFLYNCEDLVSLTVREGNRAYRDLEGVLFTADLGVLMVYPPNRGDEEYAVPPGVRRINDYAFGFTRNLRRISIPAGVREIGEAGLFYYTTNLTIIRVDPQNPVYTSREGVLFDKEMTRLLKYPEQKRGEEYQIPPSVRAIEESAFWYTGLAVVILPKELKTIGRMAFRGCGRLTRISIPPETLTVGDQAFADCGSLKRVVLSKETMLGREVFPEGTPLVYR